MRTYELKTTSGRQCFVIANNVDHAKELVLDRLDEETADYFRGAESQVTHEPGVFVNTES